MYTERRRFHALVNAELRHKQGALPSSCSVITEPGFKEMWTMNTKRFFAAFAVAAAVVTGAVTGTHTSAFHATAGTAATSTSNVVAVPLDSAWD